MGLDNRLYGSQALPGRELSMLAALYISQGLPIGLAFVALPVILRTQGASLEMIGMLGLLVLPWALKFLWAPWVDRLDGGRLGPRRSWIVPMQVALAAVFMVIAWLPQAGSGMLLLGLLLLANTLSATQDIATDGLAIERLRGRALSWVNAIQIGGFSIGMLIGGALTVVLYEHLGHVLSFMFLAVLVLLSLLPVAFGPDRPAALGQGRSGYQASFGHMLRRPGAGWALLIAGSFFFATTMKSSMTGALLVDKGLSMSEVGLVSGCGIACIALLGAPLGSWLIQRFGLRGTAWCSGVVASLVSLLWLLPAQREDVGLGLALAVELSNAVATGVIYVAFFTLFMRWASLEQAGTDFTMLQCNEELFNILAGISAGLIAGAWGYAVLFAWVAAVGLALITIIGVALRRLPLRQEESNDANA